MSGVQIRTDLRAGINKVQRHVGRVGDGTIDALIDGDGAVMAAETGQRRAIRLADGGLHGWATVGRERPGGGGVSPQGGDLRGISMMRLMAGRADAAARLPGVGGKIVGRPHDATRPKANRRQAHCQSDCQDG